MTVELEVETVVSIHWLHSVALIWLLSVEYGRMLLNSANNKITHRRTNDNWKCQYRLSAKQPIRYKQLIIDYRSLVLRVTVFQIITSCRVVWPSSKHSHIVSFSLVLPGMTTTRHDHKLSRHVKATPHCCGDHSPLFCSLLHWKTSGCQYAVSPLCDFATLVFTDGQLQRWWAST